MNARLVARMCNAVALGSLGFVLGFVPSWLWADCSQPECKEIVCVWANREFNPIDYVDNPKAAMVYANDPEGGTVTSDPENQVGYYQMCKGGGSMCLYGSTPFEAWTCFDCEFVTMIPDAFCTPSGS